MKDKPYKRAVAYLDQQTARYFEGEAKAMGMAESTFLRFLILQHKAKKENA